MQDRALNNGTERPRCCRPLIERALSFKELSRADYPTTVRAHAHQGQKTRQDRYVRRILRKAAVKTTWVESLGQDSSMCWTHIENFNLCEKFDKNTFLTKLVVYFSTNDNCYLTISSNPILSLKGFRWILTLSIFWDPLIARALRHLIKITFSERPDFGIWLRDWLKNNA